MSLDALFSIVNATALVGWVLLIALPRVSIARLIASVVIPMILAASYLVLIVIHMPGADGGFGSLPEVARLFARPGLLLVGWIHYLAFDLFIGGWETRDAIARGIPHWLLVPCLVLTFLFGPVGLLLYFVVRAVRLRQVAVS